MLVVALLLLPAMGLLIIAMDRIEDLLNAEERPRTDRHVRHLRLVRREEHPADSREPIAEHEKDAA